jgi:hypothetical protein
MTAPPPPVVGTTITDVGVFVLMVVVAVLGAVRSGVVVGEAVGATEEPTGSTGAPSEKRL